MGWDRPVAETVCEYILDTVCAPAVELGHLLIVVPTRQAGRRLGDAMTLRADGFGAALLSLQIVPPTRISDMDAMDVVVANGAEQLAAWLSVLRDVPAGDVATFLPEIPEQRDAGWCLGIY